MMTAAECAVRNQLEAALSIVRTRLAGCSVSDELVGAVLVALALQDVGDILVGIEHALGALDRTVAGRGDG
jgi:hypothetical protein